MAVERFLNIFVIYDSSIIFYSYYSLCFLISIDSVLLILLKNPKEGWFWLENIGKDGKDPRFVPYWKGLISFT